MKKNDSESTFDLTRRHFVATAAAASAGLLAGVTPFSLRAADCPAKPETLREIGAIRAAGGKLKGIIRITNARKALATNTGAQQPMMRYLEGIDQNVGTDPVWPPKGETSSLLPGPTLRVGIGELVQITLLNNVDVGAFSGLSLDNAEHGLGTGCDQAVNAPPPPADPDRNWYPGTRGDSFPNCYHASSSANLHYHGTHVTPDSFGDNVLVQVRPNKNLKPGDVADVMQDVFNSCEAHGGDGGPIPWEHVPESFRNMQAKLVKDYDMTAIWQGTRGPVKKDGVDVPALPLENQLTPANDEAIKEEEWPPYYVGAYPSCFRVTTENDHEMGQAPGTHWYHAHKHGSTSINLFNGMAGVMVIEGLYDAQLKKLYPTLKEKVMIVQQFTDQPNLELGKNKPRTKVTNGTRVVAPDLTKTPPVGQAGPVIAMQPGEIQLWRIVNAQVQTTLANVKFSGPAASTTVSPVPAFRQIAQDGVQFNRTNYNDQPLAGKDADGNGKQFDISPGGRVDILVKAPENAAAGTTYELAGVANVIICGAKVSDKFPDGSTDETYLTFPPFLRNIPPPRTRPRTITFDWEPFRLKNGPAANASTGVKATHSKNLPFEVTVGHDDDTKKLTINVNRGPYWMIDDEQFEDGKFHQTIILGDDEEWKITNTTAVAHPYHIHVNPFQVVEVYDPNNATNPQKTYKRETNGVWQDVIMIPAAKNDASGTLAIDPNTGKALEPGFIRIRSRFVDFAGTFVLHCHILGHEDRGMMQLVRVISGATKIQHH